MASKPRMGGILPPITLPEELANRLDDVLRRWKAVRPRMYPSKSAFVREALHLGMDALEPELEGEEARRIGRAARGGASVRT